MATTEDEGEKPTNNNGDDEPSIILWPANWVFYLNTITFAVGSLYCLGSLVFVYFFRKKVIIALGQPVFLYQLCIGAFLYNSYSILYLVPFWIDDGGSVWCNLGNLAGWTGGTLITIVLFAKIFRVYKVTRLKRRQTVYARHIIAPYIIIVTAGIIVQVTRTIVAPGVFERNYHIPDADVVVNYCDTTNSDSYFFAAMSIIEYTTFLGILFFAWKVRTIQEEIGESHRIFWLICVQFIWQITISTLNRLVTVGEHKDVATGDKHKLMFVYNAVYVIYAADSFIYPVISISFLIVPRMYYVYYEYRNGSLPDHVQQQIPASGHSHVQVNSDTIIS